MILFTRINVKILIFTSFSNERQVDLTLTFTDERKREKRNGEKKNSSCTYTFRVYKSASDLDLSRTYISVT